SAGDARAHPGPIRGAGGPVILHGVVETRYRWVFPSPVTVDASFRLAAARLGLSGRLTDVLAGRGLDTAADLEWFFAPHGSGLHDPGLLPGAAIFFDLLPRARDSGERGMGLGDIDAD